MMIKMINKSQNLIQWMLILKFISNRNQIQEPRSEDETNLRSDTKGIVDVHVGLIEKSKERYVILETVTFSKLRSDC